MTKKIKKKQRPIYVNRDTYALMQKLHILDDNVVIKEQLNETDFNKRLEEIRNEKRKRNRV